jgi:hypothetical protein
MKRLHYFCLSLLWCAVLIGCTKAIRPPDYGDTLMSQEDVIEKMGSNVKSLKIIADINLEKADAHFSVKGMVLMKQPEMLILKLYRLGFPIFALSMHEGTVSINSTKEGDAYRDLSLLLYHCLMWWDGLEEAEMFASLGKYYFIDSERELVINGRRLFPEHQKLFYMDKKIDIFYEKPIFVDDLWYPSLINVKLGESSFTFEITKLIVNPDVEESSFVIPS